MYSPGASATTGDAATSAARTRTSRVTDPPAGNASFVITVAHPQPHDGYVTVSRKLMYGRIWQLLGNVNSTSFELTFSSRNVIVAVSPRAIVDGLICASKRTAVAGDGADGASPHAMTDPARRANAVSRNDEFSIITSSSRALIMQRCSPSDKQRSTLSSSLSIPSSSCAACDEHTRGRGRANSLKRVYLNPCWPRQQRSL